MRNCTEILRTVRLRVHSSPGSPPASPRSALRCSVPSRSATFTSSGAPSLPHDASNPPLSAILGWACQVATCFSLHSQHRFLPTSAIAPLSAKRPAPQSQVHAAHVYERPRLRQPSGVSPFRPTTLRSISSYLPTISAEEEHFLGIPHVYPLIFAPHHRRHPPSTKKMLLFSRDAVQPTPMEPETGHRPPNTPDHQPQSPERRPKYQKEGRPPSRMAFPTHRRQPLRSLRAVHASFLCVFMMSSTPRMSAAPATTTTSAMSAPV